MLSEQEKRAEFYRATGKVATLSETEYYAFCKGVELGKASVLEEQAKAEPAEAVQWRNIKHVVRTLADWAFGSKNDPRYGACWLAVVNGLTCKDGPDFKLEPLHPAPAPEGMVLVPREPTLEMLDCLRADTSPNLEKRYRAMIAAAEKP